MIAPVSESLPLRVWDRHADRPVTEWMKDSPQTYEIYPRGSFRNWLESLALYDWMLAAYENSRWSAREIQPFIEEHDIDMSEFEPVRYRSFAAFFERRFRPGARVFTANPKELAAFAEARYFGWERHTPDQEFPVKGQALRAEAILGDVQRAHPFRGGPVLLARLSPVDYHHVHYPLDGHTVSYDRRGHGHWTVNPHALTNQTDILFKNERQINVLDAGDFGLIAFVEVGALSVGRIAQTHPLDKPFTRGEEKSVFKFGGSAIVVFGEPRKWRPSSDVLAHTREGMETHVRLGEPLGHRVAPDPESSS